MTLQEIAMDFMRGNDRNFFAIGLNFHFNFWGKPVYPESIWYSDDEDKIYIHVGCEEFEGDLDIDSLSGKNKEILKDALKYKL